MFLDRIKIIHCITHLLAIVIRYVMIIKTEIRNDDLAHVELLIGVDLIAIFFVLVFDQGLVLMCDLDPETLADV